MRVRFLSKRKHLGNPSNADDSCSSRANHQTVGADKDPMSAFRLIPSALIHQFDSRSWLPVEA